jgi:MATE family multidrug resistance protein
MSQDLQATPAVCSAETGDVAAFAAVPPPSDGSYRSILKLTAPLILSSTGMMLMHLMDAIFLARHSEEAIAAVGPASLAGFLPLGLAGGIAGYTSVFVAQYVGAGKKDRVGSAVWQGVHIAVVSGILIAIGGFLLAAPLFRAAGHAPELQSLETRYFQIMCLGAPFSLIGSAVSGFFSGRSDNKTLMAVQLGGFALNGLLSYAFIFEKWGCVGAPGAIGAALATTLVQGVVGLVLLAIFLSARHQMGFNTRHTWSLDIRLFRRLLYYGSFNGFRFLMEIFAWAMFLGFVGRLGNTDIAVTNIVWRVNGFAFFPLIGLSTAIASLVGQAQGNKRPGLAERICLRGVLIAECWMLFAAAIFLILPRPILGLFADQNTFNPEHFREMLEMGVLLLRWVALYCLLDGLNIVFIGALQGAGDTRWSLIASVILHVGFVVCLYLLDQCHATVYTFWAAAAAFVMFQALVWMARFKAGKWKTMSVIEEHHVVL